MKTAILIIAVLTTGTPRIEFAYPMPSLATCERVRDHAAVRESYPGRVIYCVEK